MYNRQLETFVQVAEHGSFSKAAQAMYITPTAVIRQMNLFEKHLGVKLFNRTYRGLSLTEAGECVFEGARRIIAYSREVTQRACELDSMSSRPVLRVGAAVMTPSSPILGLLSLIRERYPDIVVKLVSFESTPEEVRRIFADFDAAGIDVLAGIFEDRYLEARGCSGLLLSEEPIQLALPLDHPLAGRDELAMEDLAGQSVLIAQEGWNADVDALRADLATNHPEVNIVDFTHYSIEVFNYCSNEGAFLTTIGPWREVHPLLKTVPVRWDHRVSFGILHSRRPSPLVADFLEEIRRNVAPGAPRRA